MKNPIPNFYDSSNARALVALAAEAYGGDGMAGQGQWVDDRGTDTRVVVWRMDGDVVVAFRGTESLRNFVTDICARRVPFWNACPMEAEVHEGFLRALNSIYAALYDAVEKALAAARPAGGRLWITGHSNPTLPQTGSTSFSGGTQWFWGYCIDNDRSGEPGAESFNYKFAGPYQFFFERLIFQKLNLTWNGSAQIADYQSDVVLGLSLTTLTGTGDTVQGTTATNLMSIAQQIKEICMYAQSDSAYQQANNGLGWPGTAVSGQPAGAQFQCDQLTSEIDGINWDLLQTPSTNVLIADFAGTALTGKTSASALAAASYMLRCPLDAVNAITCAEAMRRQLQWLGGIGSPVVWTDHSQTPPQLHIATRAELAAVSLPLTGITVKNKIKARPDLIPAAVHFKYKVSGTFLGQAFSVVINDVAAYIGGSLVEGIGQFGVLTDLNNNAISGPNQTALMAAAKTATAVVQTFDFQGDQVKADSCKITCASISSALTSASDAMWHYFFPELANVTGLAFYSGQSITINDAITGASYYASGAWTGTAYSNVVQDGQVAPWMLASGSTPANPVGGKTIKAKLTVRFAYQEQAQGTNAVNTSTVGYHEKNITVTLTTLATGTYYSNPSVAYGEPIPYGLAGYMLALETIPQYEGSILVQETEISDVCPIGNALNISGGLAAWGTMKACVQSVRYSDNGQTEITFGPAKHLGPSQFVARFRSNAGPRWFLLINTDPMNQSTGSGASSLGNNIPAQAPSSGNKNYSFQSLFTNLPGDQSGSPASLPAGVHIDSGAAGCPFVGAIASGSRAFGQGQGLTLAQGPAGSTPGESNAWIRISLHDLTNSGNVLQNLQVYLRELGTCENIGGTPTLMYRLFLCSNPYATSIGI